jgi:UDP-N-acetylglucosamine transferase subunit ALG13
MIFVSVGTNEARFDRLLRAVAELKVQEELVVQHGHSAGIERPRTELVDFLSFEEMVATIRRARVVVTHAGVGSVMVSLANDKCPVVVPRLKSFGEAVDDHQLQLGRRFAAAGLVTLVEAPDGLAAALAAEQQPAAIVPSASSLAADLTSFLESMIPRPLAPAPA